MNATNTKYRLTTRSDFDGLVCAMLLRHFDIVDEIRFVHPKDMQDGKVELTARDVTANLPYVPGVHMAFDHHLSEVMRNPGQHSNHVIQPEAASASRVVFNHYSLATAKKAFPVDWEDMLAAVDKCDCARFTREEILRPEKWDLLNFIMDARTGLGRFRNFRISNYRLMLDLIDYCKNHPIDKIMRLPDVRERVDLYFEHENKFREQLMRCTSVRDNVAVLDLRREQVIYAGNRFMIYALYPETNISIHVLSGLKDRNTVFAMGKSIINRTASTNISELMLHFGGGGHENVGTCQVENDRAGRVLQTLVARARADQRLRP